VTEHRSPARAADLFAEVLGPIRSGRVTCNLEALAEGRASAMLPDELFGATSSETCAAEVARCERLLADHAALGTRPPRALDAEHRAWLRRLGVAMKREQLEAERRAACPDCFCLGFGGRGSTHGLAVEAPDGRLLCDPTVEVWSDPCPCPIGQDRSAEARARRSELLAEDRQRRLSKLWSDLKLPAGLGEEITLDTHIDRRAMEAVRRWQRGETEQPGLALGGPSQRGKTTTAYLLARQAIRDGLGVVAMTVPDLIERLTDTFHHDQRLKSDPDQPPQATHRQVIESLQAVGFLLLDDLGVEKLSEYVERALYQILNARAEAGLATVITTNLKYEEIGARYGDRIGSRILKACEWVPMVKGMMGPAAPAF
jgi:DNA replication protein DnaC